jgi:hypothetical protein
MLRRVALVRTDVSEELSTFSIRVTRFNGLGTTLAVTSNRRTLRTNINLTHHYLVATVYILPSCHTILSPVQPLVCRLSLSCNTVY